MLPAPIPSGRSSFRDTNARTRIVPVDTKGDSLPGSSSPHRVLLVPSFHLGCVGHMHWLHLAGRPPSWSSIGVLEDPAPLPPTPVRLFHPGSVRPQQLGGVGVTVPFRLHPTWVGRRGVPMHRLGPGGEGNEGPRGGGGFKGTLVLWLEGGVGTDGLDRKGPWIAGGRELPFPGRPPPASTPLHPRLVRQLLPTTPRIDHGSEHRHTYSAVVRRNSPRGPGNGSQDWCGGSLQGSPSGMVSDGKRIQHVLDPSRGQGERGARASAVRKVRKGTSQVLQARLSVPLRETLPTVALRRLHPSGKRAGPPEVAAAR
eukprot:scaffold435_cov342-Pavlova_lutheri.AAC.42